MSDYDNNNNGDYDENAARFAGDTVGSAGKSSTHSPPHLNFITNTLRTEGGYDRADQAFNNEEQNIGNSFRNDAQAVEDAPENMARRTEQGFDNTVNDAENIPSDIGGGLRGAASWIGDKIGGVQNEGQRAENDVQNQYNDGKQDVDQFGQGVQNDYNDGRQNVDQFGDGMQNSYNQGEQQGRQDGW
jgi:hypothetical protein